jgi:iron complex transport system substrate-binding protein
VKTRPGYAQLKAVQSGLVYSIEDDLVTLPGPRIVDGLEQMAQIIHPELFE